MALIDIPGFPGMSVMDCGFGNERLEHSQNYRPFLPRKRIEILAPDNLVEMIFTTIMCIANSGQHGDGKVYILDVIEGGRISTGERTVDLG